MKKYIALTTLDGLFIQAEEERSKISDKADKMILNAVMALTIDEAAREFGCTVDTIGGHRYLTSTSVDALANTMFVCDLPGAIVEVTAIYDSETEITTTERE